MHDWGGLIGLRWACDHPGAVSALFITDTGFFPDGRWHGMAKTLRTEGEGEQLVENVNRDLFGDGAAATSARRSRTTRSTSTGRPSRTQSAGGVIWTCTAPATSRSSRPTTARLGALGVPALIVWGAKDEFAPVGGAHRFHKQIPGARLVVLDDAGHYVMEDAPEQVGGELEGFLESL